MTIHAAFWPLGGRKRTPYKPGTVLLECKGGVTTTKTITLKAGIYYLELVGAGSGVAGPWVYSGNVGVSSPSGGGGAAFVGEVFLAAGTYSYQCADPGYCCNANYCTNHTAGGQTFLQLDANNFIRCNETPKPPMGQGKGPAGGTLTKVTGDKLKIKKEVIASNGNQGQGSNFWSYLPGGASLYKGFGKGAGPSKSNLWDLDQATSGYLKLTFLRI